MKIFASLIVAAFVFGLFATAPAQSASKSDSLWLKCSRGTGSGPDPRRTGRTRSAGARRFNQIDDCVRRGGKA
jgi:hypothetical protein